MPQVPYVEDPPEEYHGMREPDLLLPVQPEPRPDAASQRKNVPLGTPEWMP